MTADHIKNNICHIEVLTPRQDSKDLDKSIDRFVTKYTAVTEAGYVLSIPDNPLGNVHFQTLEMISELELPALPEQTAVHINTFHTKQDLDKMLADCTSLGFTTLLIISGDGSERLPKLQPESIGVNTQSVTSVELLQYIHREHPGVFECGVAYNPYEPADHEVEKLHRKIDAGAAYVVTQPILGEDDRVNVLRSCGIPGYIGGWMSKKIHLLSECVGYEIPEDTPYDPMGNLKQLYKSYSDFGMYLAMVGFKTQFPYLKDIWTNAS